MPLFLAISLGLSSCKTFAASILEIPILEANNGENYRDQSIKVCGFATNEFENYNLTENTADHWSQRGVILGVKWLKKEPKTTGPENRCVTGKLAPRGGWDSYERNYPEKPSENFFGGGMTGADWVIIQTNLSRD